MTPAPVAATVQDQGQLPAPPRGPVLKTIKSQRQLTEVRRLWYGYQGALMAAIQAGSVADQLFAQFAQYREDVVRETLGIAPNIPISIDLETGDVRVDLTARAGGEGATGLPTPITPGVEVVEAQA